jgi:hypothetical protein
MYLFGGYKDGIRSNDILTYRFENGKWSDLNP